MRRLKRFLAPLLAAVLVIGLVPVIAVLADDYININSATFPDDTFRQVIADNYDTDGDGKLSNQERAITLMSLSGLIDTEYETISDLTGIEYFGALRTLRCGGIGLETLDVSSLSNLLSLTCQGNLLTELDVTALPSLVTLNCSDNELTELEIPSNNSIQTLYCYANHLEGLMTQYLTNAVAIRCDQNELTAIRLYCQNLQEFNCSYNHLTILDLSQTNLAFATEYMISPQSVTATATAENGQIVIPYQYKGINSANYRGSTLEQYDGCGLVDYIRFVATDVSQITPGFSYDCYPMLEGAENMTVNVTVERSFSQVSFYSDSTLTQSISSTFVANGGNVTPPSVTPPTCKALDGWSEPLTAVSTDLSVYPLYRDSHSYAATALAANGNTVTVTCSVCGDSYQTSFIAAVNKSSADSGWDGALDLVGDGIINEKDYAELKKLN